VTPPCVFTANLSPQPMTLRLTRDQPIVTRHNSGFEIGLQAGRARPGARRQVTVTVLYSKALYSRGSPGHLHIHHCAASQHAARPGPLARTGGQGHSDPGCRGPPRTDSLLP
jgi:hypothetical protein